MIKKYHLAFVISLSILGTIFAITQFTGAQNTAVKQSPESQVIVSNTYDATIKGDKEITGDAADSISVGNAHSSIFDASVLALAIEDVGDYIEFNQYADRAQKKTALFEKWALDPKMLKLQQDILVKTELAESVFGENQAHARLLAIDYLGYLSKNGQRDAIEHTIYDLSKRINNEPWVKGVEHDYVDLMFKYTDSLTQDELMSNFEEIIEFSGYSKKSHDLFTTGLSLSETVLLLPDSKMEELRTRLKLVKEQL
ncbi:hypothetical protein [Pseudoalteromonas byunsanensis]|uniref:Uncharacterized protein n=1 Tax=Pseudoalteromonas byunsanensis TaxID=327939 RepID=A0A1S1NB10_9GAMM|nr:hypothetical protein [Pseudoalteromonas byunsanensis]OHU97269.1 hypothetical protein BIW53_02830 [Pseudoalteromonas byunsanensis]